MSLFCPKLLQCLQDYSLSTFKKDALAGLAVGIVAIPLGIAFAIASGASPESGLVTAAVAGFLTSLLGGSRVAIGGPTGAFIVIILGIVQQYGMSNLIICTIMAGIILLVMGIFRLGAFINYIPYPLISGFTSGIAVLIFSTQLKDFLGLPPGGTDSGFISSIGTVFGSLSLVDPPTLILSMTCLLAIMFWPKNLAKALPGPIAVLILATVVSWGFDLPVVTIGDRFGGFQGGWPSFQTPSFNWDTFHFLLGPAVTIALLGAIESLLCAVVADGMIGDRHDPNQELMAQGIANIVTPFFGGLPATGAIARTATNIRNGGSTPVAGIIHSVVCLLVLLVAAPVAKAVPLAVLSAILMAVALNMGQWREFLRLKRYPKSDDTVFLLTFILTVVFDLTVAVEIGMITAAILFIKRVAGQTNVEIRPMVLAVDEIDLATPTKGINEEILILRIYGELFFGAAQKLQTAMRYLAGSPKVIIIKMKYVFSLDASSLVVLNELVSAAQRRGIRVFISGLSRQPLDVVKKSGLYEQVGPEAFFRDQAAAVEAACLLVESLKGEAAQPESAENT
ncbi:sodium-independent anion transporter [Deltaproteobacteria bacterium Smac51]|nr:sodium-independent anion transporter [Deltaproteobacteria bacterium Smac51]